MAMDAQLTIDFFVNFIFICIFLQVIINRCIGLRNFRPPSYHSPLVFYFLFKKYGIVLLKLDFATEYGCEIEC